MSDHPFVQFLVLGTAILGFFILVKYAANLLPQSGWLGTFRGVVLTA